MSEPHLFHQFVERGINTVRCRQVLVDGALDLSGEAPPHPGLDEPEQELVPLLG